MKLLGIYLSNVMYDNHLLSWCGCRDIKKGAMQDSKPNRLRYTLVSYGINWYVLNIGTAEELNAIA